MGGEINNGDKKLVAGVYSVENHGYCLRWNNHQANLAQILESLIRMECYVDITIYVEGQVQFKAHRVVLAACSPFFRLILQDAPQDHCSMVFPGISEFEMRALLEYIYVGEVNIAESQIPRIMKLAKMLEVKGLHDLIDLTSNINQQQQQAFASPPNNNNSHRPVSHPSVSAEQKLEQSAYLHMLPHSSPIINKTKISSAQSSSSPPYSLKPLYGASLYPHPINASRELIADAAGHDSHEERNPWSGLQLGQSRSAQSMLSSVYQESGSDMNPLKRKKIHSMLMTRDTPILRNVLAQSNVADSSQSALPLTANPSPPRGGNGTENIENNDTNNNERSSNSFAGSNVASTSSGNNGTVYHGYMRKSSDRSYHSSNGSDHSDKKSKDDGPSSPLTDRSFDDDQMTSERRPSPPEFLADIRLPPYLQQHQLQQAQFHQQHHGQGNQGGSGQKPEWKRYKQYTRNDILSAIECVRNGMSALQASRKFGVPSRTLYDKVKKMGITTGTPRNRSSIKREGREPPGPCSSTAAFPYRSLSSAAAAFSLYPNQDNQLSQSQDFEAEQEELKLHRPPSLLDPVFLQQALEARGEEFRGDALHAMALAAAAHAQFNGMGRETSPRNQGSQSPSLLSKYIKSNLEAELSRERERNRLNGEHTAIKSEPVDESEDEPMESTETAENLSVAKREPTPSVTPPPPTLIRTPPYSVTPDIVPRGVIVPPMRYSSPRSEPSSTTPPTIMDLSALSIEKSELKQNLADPSNDALTPSMPAECNE